MRLLTDPQPAIEWFCTGGSVCIGVEGLDDLPDSHVVREVRRRPAVKAKAQVSFGVTAGEA
jgi:hypothetical protein